MKKTTVAGIVIAIMLFICSTVEAEPAQIAVMNPNGPIYTVNDDVITYIAYGRERVTLPESVIKDINAWYDAYMVRLEEWCAEDGSKWDLYYSGLEEGYNYALNSIMARLGYYNYYTCELEGIEANGWDNEATIYNHELESDMALEDYIVWENATFGVVE